MLSTTSYDASGEPNDTFHPKGGRLYYKRRAPFTPKAGAFLMKGFSVSGKQLIGFHW
jgi:hypothetical protein